MSRPDDGEFASRRPSILSEGDAIVLAPTGRLKKRAEFLAVAKGRRQHQRCFVLLALARRDISRGDLANRDLGANGDLGAKGDLGAAARFGFTVTKKTGNSVIRNRIRRRLREVVRLDAAVLAHPNMDYVLVGRIEALTAGFQELRGEFARAQKKIHSAERKPNR